MSCPNPIDAAILAEYWFGALSITEEDVIEEHLLACDACGARLREVIALAAAVRKLAHTGSLRMVVSDAFLQCAAEQGLRIRQYAPPAGGSVRCTVTAEDDILIGRLAASLNTAKRIDLSICDGHGMEQMRLADIPFHPEGGSVAFQESITYLKAAPSQTMIARVIAFDDTGRERLLGEYTFHHKRTLPGPDASSQGL